MAKGLAKKDAPPADEGEGGKGRRGGKGGKGASTAAEPAPKAAPTKVGPPLLLVALGYASVLVSLPLIAVDGVPAHVIGYVTGALIPILIIGIVRRVDLDRRRSPYYVPKGLFRPLLATLAVAALVAALLHIWPIATELAS